jgi:Protein kinase domain
MSSPLAPGTLIEQRYAITQVLGYGGFGRTYLAQDRNRFDEPCVLKEFAPQVQGPESTQKAAELFQREAGVLYQLKHPQIPSFRELLQAKVEGRAALFLVEQFIPGQPYSTWVETGRRLSQAEGLDLLLDLLPVLTYLHGKGVIHRDISPDNLIREEKTGKPVLIDFGSVSQVAAAATQAFGQGNLTQIRKLGYTPPEQIRGEAYPSSDLYALAVTALVLMAGQWPSALYDEARQVWDWKSQLVLDPRFVTLFDRLLAPNPFDRYQSAQELRQALQSLQAAGPLVGLPAVDPVFAQQAAELRAAANFIPPLAKPVPHASEMKTWAVAPATPQRSPLAPPAALAPLAHPLAPAPAQLPAQPLAPRPVRRTFLTNMKTWVVAPARRSADTRMVVAPPVPDRPPDLRPAVAEPPSPPRWGGTPMRPVRRGLGWMLLLPFRLLGWGFKLVWNCFRAVGWVMMWIWRLIVILLMLAIGALALLWWKPELVRPLIASFSTGLSSAPRTQSRACQSIDLANYPNLGLTSSQFYAQVNQRLYSRHPELGGRMLTDRPEDAALREEWCQIGQDLLKDPPRRQATAQSGRQNS